VGDCVRLAVLPKFAGQRLPIRRPKAEAGKETGLARAVGGSGIEQVVHELFAFDDDEVGVGEVPFGSTLQAAAA